MKADIKIEKRKLIPSLFYLIKLGVFAILTHFLIIPLIFQTFTFFGELRSIWQVVTTVIISVYLSDIIQLKIGGRDYF